MTLKGRAKPIWGCDTFLPEGGLDSALSFPKDEKASAIEPAWPPWSAVVGGDHTGARHNAGLWQSDRKVDKIVGEGMVLFSWEEQRQLWLLCSKDDSGIHRRELALGFGSLGSWNWTRTLAGHLTLAFRPFTPPSPTHLQAVTAFPWLPSYRHQGEGIWRPALAAERQLHAHPPPVLFPWLWSHCSQQLSLLPQGRLQHHREVSPQGPTDPPHPPQLAPTVGGALVILQLLRGRDCGSTLFMFPGPGAQPEVSQGLLTEWTTGHKEWAPLHLLLVWNQA